MAAQTKHPSECQANHPMIRSRRNRVFTVHHSRIKTGQPIVTEHQRYAQVRMQPLQKGWWMKYDRDYGEQYDF